MVDEDSKISETEGRVAVGPGGKSAIVLGASGLVGSELMRVLQTAGYYKEIIALVRQPLRLQPVRGIVRELVIDFDSLETHTKLVADHVYCAFGTTIRKAGSQERFRQVDLEYPLEIARLTRRAGADHFVLVSSKGASSASSNFYLRVKGELEDSLKAMAWPHLTILRPSVIGGSRNESRPLESIARTLLSIGPASIRTVAASDIAAAMVRAASNERPPKTRVLESAEIRAVASSSS